MMRLLITILLCAAGMAAQTTNYFASTGINYDFYGRTPAISTGFGLRIGNSNAFSLTNINSALVKGQTSATLATGIEYHIAAKGLSEFMGYGGAGVTTDGNVTLGNFAGGVGISYDIGLRLTRGRVSLPAVLQVRITTITATQVKPVYSLEFRKTF